MLMKTQPVGAWWWGPEGKANASANQAHFSLCWLFPFASRFKESSPCWRLHWLFPFSPDTNPKCTWSVLPLAFPAGPECQQKSAWLTPGGGFSCSPTTWVKMHPVGTCGLIFLICPQRQ